MNLVFFESFKTWKLPQIKLKNNKKLKSIYLKYNYVTSYVYGARHDTCLVDIITHQALVFMSSTYVKNLTIRLF